MKILYSIQATGNGHLIRAKEILPELMKVAEVDIMVSGTMGDIDLGMDIKYKSKGISFVYNNKGGLSYLKTLKNINLRRIKAEIQSIDFKQYDLVISDFEPISAWGAKLNKVKCLNLSHQASYLTKLTPRPFCKNHIGELIFKFFVPHDYKIGFHFMDYDNFILGPILKETIIKSKKKKENHITIYLPSFSDEFLIDYLQQFETNNDFHVFSRTTKREYRNVNVIIKPINDKEFNKSLISCSGVICGGGFETPSEAIFLKKKLITIPIKGQYEQICNVEALKQMGFLVLYNLNNKNSDKIQMWLNNEFAEPDFELRPTKVEDVVKMILDLF